MNQLGFLLFIVLGDAFDVVALQFLRCTMCFAFLTCISFCITEDMRYMP